MKEETVNFLLKNKKFLKKNLFQIRHICKDALELKEGLFEKKKSLYRTNYESVLKSIYILVFLALVSSL